MVRYITILFVMLMASVVHGQVLAVRTVERSCYQNSCSTLTGRGSCTYLGNAGEKSVYVTAAHVVEAEGGGDFKIYIGYGASWWGAVVVHKVRQGEDDYAIIETRKIPAKSGYRLAKAFPAHNTDAVAYGYSGGFVNLKAIRSKIRIRSNLKGIYTSVNNGDSGGPIMVNGEVVGVVSATMKDDGMTVCTPSSVIQPELDRIYKGLLRCNCGPRRVVIRQQVIQPVTIQPVIEPTPDPISIDNTSQINALEIEVARLRLELKKLQNTKIPVEVYEKGKLVAKEVYPLGDTIKLTFDAVNGK